eukprot:1675510-Prymnesium_polylepis.1
MLSALVADRGRASRGQSSRAGVLKRAQPCPGRLLNPVETVKTTYTPVVRIWYLATKTAALHGRIGMHNSPPRPGPSRSR